MATVYKEVWTGELVKQLSHADQGTFLDGVPDYSDKAENEVIHLVDVGGDPAVLINNTTYPIPVQNLPDGDIAISLDKYQTEVTRVTDDELYALSYGKIKSVKDRHGNAIIENKQDKAIHALAPASDTANTPVIATTGPDDGMGRLRLVRKDILELKKRYDAIKAPQKNRRLVLSPEHIADLIVEDTRFEAIYANHKEGKITKMYGFDVFEYVSTPYYNAGGTKLSFGAVPGGTDRQASVSFLVKRAFKAKGKTKMYFSKAENNPETQENLLNFRHYFITLPKKWEGFGAIY